MKIIEPKDGKCVDVHIAGLILSVSADDHFVHVNIAGHVGNEEAPVFFNEFSARISLSGELCVYAGKELVTVKPEDCPEEGAK